MTFPNLFLAKRLHIIVQLLTLLIPFLRLFPRQKKKCCVKNLGKNLMGLETFPLFNAPFSLMAQIWYHWIVMFSSHTNVTRKLFINLHLKVSKSLFNLTFAENHKKKWRKTFVSHYQTSICLRPLFSTFRWDVFNSIHSPLRCWSLSEYFHQFHFHPLSSWSDIDLW